MTRKLTLLLLSLLTATTAFAETSRYMVVMKKPQSGNRLRLLSNAADRIERRVRELRTVDAFGADLTAAEAAELRQSPDVESVQRVVPRSLLSDGTPVAPMATGPFAAQVTPWGVDMVNAAPVWAVKRGEGVNVAVVDTGIASSHPDLAGNLAGGFNAFDKDAAPDDDHGHGTHVAGTIAAVDNDFGVIGVAPKATLWAVKVLDGTGNGNDETLSAGIDWVIAKKREIGGPWVVNMSLGSLEPSATEVKVFARAAEEGIILIAASGNMGFEFATFPARYPEVMAVGAIDEQKNLALFSNYGNMLDIVAPGVLVPSSYLPGAVRWAETELGLEKVQTFGMKGSAFGTVRTRFVDCGYGRPEDFPAEVLGKIALIQRGPAGAALYFREKARNAKERGAVGVIIYNNDDANGPTYPDWTLLVDPPWDYEFPLTVAMSNANGKKLLANPNSIIRITHGVADYNILSGTSMASPHAVGAAALLLSLKPNARRTEIERALEHGAADLNTFGWDYKTAWGMVDAFGAAKIIAPEAFGLPAPVTRRRSAH